MKRILITGAGSYIGTSVENWLSQPEFSGMYEVDTVDMRGVKWKEKDFSGYDTVFHVAGIAHKRESKHNAPLYYKVNRDLAIETAKKAKEDGARQFVLLSSMSVFGVSEGCISSKTDPHPKSHYGESKLDADKRIKKLNTETFYVAILRPPMVYGAGCKGNYQLLRKAALLSPVFPMLDNQRSMIYIDNLAEFVRIVIEKNEKGIFYPQNLEYVSTSEMVKQIATAHSKKIIMVRFFSPIIKNLPFPIVKKVFGNLTYERDACPMCQMVTFAESIKKIEGQQTRS